jgi:tetratricopeptide (TPR) repeat protein
MRFRYVVVPLLVVAACSPKRVHERPILQNGDRVGSADATIEAARADAARTQLEAQGQRDAATAAALADCAPAVCAAITRGEVALGMTETQVLAATRTTGAAWQSRDAGDATVMVPAARTSGPRDAVGEVAMVHLRGGRVSAYSYAEAQGVRLVASPADATTAGRASGLAEMLLREGDDLVARGEFDMALNRYDRAQVLRPDDAQIDYRIATLLDKQLRPIEALIRYQLFLHRLELEKIQAVGEAYGHLANAIAHARERVIVLERQTRSRVRRSCHVRTRRPHGPHRRPRGADTVRRRRLRTALRLVRCRAQRPRRRGGPAAHAPHPRPRRQRPGTPRPRHRAPR